MTTFALDWIKHHTEFSPNKLAAYDLASARRFTYQEYNARIEKVASFLNRSLGVQAGDRVAVLCYNDSDMFELQFACQRLAAIFLPINWRLAIPELEYICTDGAPRVLCYGKELTEAATAVGEACNIPELVDLANGAPSRYEEGIANADGVYDARAVVFSDTWTIMYTSGTTGRPKGARITYEMANFNAFHACVSVDITSRSRNLVVLPIFHTGGLNVWANPAFHSGGANVVMRTFESTVFLDLMTDKELGLTHVLGVPTNFLMTSQEPGFAGADLSHIEVIGVGGAAASEALIQRFGAKGLFMQQMWGMTETGPIGLVLPKEMSLAKVGSSGLPAMHCQLRIVDEDGNDIPIGETGELLIKGPNVTPGYWNREAERDQFYTADGWFKTGDAARQDEDSYYYIVDRWKDMFISGGENVYPVEVENVIYQLDGVLENAVVGIPDDKWGEVGRAFVVLKPGANLDEEAVTGYCKERLATFKVPKQVCFIEELPHNATGKVLKHELPRA